MSYILVIDDEEPIRNALREILEYEKFKVLEAENGIIGLELLKKNKVDVVLCDIKCLKWMALKYWKKYRKLQIFQL